VTSSSNVSRPAWWPTKEQKERADKACADAQAATETSTTQPTRAFAVGKPVGSGHTWGEVASGDRFHLPHGETIVVKSRTKHYVSFHGDRPIDGNINPIHTLHPDAIYLGAAA
jgi:hypothetical protein